MARWAAVIAPPGCCFVIEEPGIREALNLILHWAWNDFVLTTTGSGDRCWRHIHRVTPDLLITDVRHPGMSVDEMLHRLYRGPKRFPIIVYSAHLDRAEIRARLARFNMFPVFVLDKPCTVAELHRQVHRAFGLPATGVCWT